LINGGKIAMNKAVTAPIRTILRSLHLDVVRYPQPFPSDFEQSDIDTVNAVREYTSTSPERIFALSSAVKYVVANDIPGDIVECGVWRGGSMMAVARALLQLGDMTRDLYLYDTFEGMPRPTGEDVSYGGEIAIDRWETMTSADGQTTWSNCSLEEVKAALFSVGYDNSKIHFRKGKVEETIPAYAPPTISLLRLDTDWYESTYHELVHLFPRLSPGGVIILDDYGHWLGARKATDEYIEKNKIRLLLNRIDYTGRIGVKC
jgi:O-methyltransferase